MLIPYPIPNYSLPYLFSSTKCDTLEKRKEGEKEVMFSKQFKLTLASIFLFVFIFGLLSHIAILTFRVQSLEKQTNTNRLVIVEPTKAPVATITVTATPSAGLRVASPTKSVTKTVAPSVTVAPTR